MSFQSTPRRLSSSRRRVVTEIVRLMTPDYPDLGEPERSRARSAATAFVTSQIEGLPPFMAFPYGIAITAFELLPLLRFGRPFQALDEEAQRAYLSRWNDAKLGPFRDFVKLIRSCALLAYFDHPDVIRGLPGAHDGRPAEIDSAPQAS